MQLPLGFQIIENYRLLYDQVFESIIQSIKTPSSIKGYEFLADVKTVDHSTFLEVMQYREMLIKHSSSNTTNEEEYRQKLITPLLTSVLGYELGSLRPEKKLQDFGRIDDLYAWNDRYLPIESKQYGRLQGDAYRITKRTNADPIFQITSYLKGVNYKLFERKQTHIDAPYAILTDGLERRLYTKDMLTNDLHPSCLVIRLDQLDLTDMDAVHQTLTLFTLFFGEQATRRGGVLDKIFDENETRSLKIKEKLGKQVYDAVEYIANGIFLKISGWSEEKKRITVEYYKTHFSGYEQDKQAWLMKVLYHESLVYLFRIIFGLYAEDRGLLETVHIQYGLKAGPHNLLQDLQKKFGDTHGGKDRKTNDHVYQFMQNEDVVLENLYFGPINDKYNGGLFDPKRHPLLAEFDINDRYFLRAVDYLMRTQDPNRKGKLATISYAQLDVRHLGTIYENLLEFSLVDNTGSDADILPLSVVNDKGERKSTGSYYTPDYIVEYIVQQTVGVKIDEIVAGNESVQQQCDAIMGLTVCDPAMGSGHFLIEVVTYIETRIQELLDTLDEQEQARLSQCYTKSQIASRCVYGVDINYLAVELAKVVMWIKTFEEDTPLQFLDANLKRGNSLIGTRIDQMFDSDKMKNLNQLFNDMHWAKKKTTQAVSQIAETIDRYIGGASQTDKSLEDQKKQIKLKESLFGMLSKRYFEQVRGISSRLGDDLPGTQGLGYKERSKAKKAHLQKQREALQNEYGDLNPFADWKALRDFYQIALAAYNAKYLLTVPLALEFFPESHNAINLNYASQVSSMLGKGPTHKGGNANLSLDNIHLPATKAQESEHGLTIQQAVDQVIQDINPFHRELEFPTVFAKGGFDCVVGNPPYLKERDNKEIFHDISKGPLGIYKQSRVDLWFFFVHLSIDIVKKSGFIGIITNSYWTGSAGASKLIARIDRDAYVREVIDFNDLPIFKGVSGKHMIHIYEKLNNEKNYNRIMELKFVKSLGKENNLIDDIVTLTQNEFIINGMSINMTGKKIVDLTSKKTFHLGDKYIVSQGVVEASNIVSKNAHKKIKPIDISVGDGVFVLSDKEIDAKGFQKVSFIKNYLNLEHVSRYHLKASGLNLIYSDKKVKEEIQNGKYPLIKEHLDKYHNFITSSNKPYGIHRFRKKMYFESPKIICPGMFDDPQCVYDDKGYYVGFSFSVIVQNDKNYSLKYLLTIINSKLGKYWFHANGKRRGVGVDIGVQKYREFPIAICIEYNQQPFIDAADVMLDLHATQHELISSAHRLIMRRYEIEKLGRKLEKFYELDFAEFLQELTKKNKTLKSMKLDEEQRLEEWFVAESKKINDLQSQIDAKDKEIDEMVFDLYELTAEEREVVLKG